MPRWVADLLACQKGRFESDHSTLVEIDSNLCNVVYMVERNNQNFEDRTRTAEERKTISSNTIQCWMIAHFCFSSFVSIIFLTP